MTAADGTGIVWDDAPAASSAPATVPALKRPDMSAGGGIQWDSPATTSPAAGAPALKAPRSAARAAGDLATGLGEGVVSAGMFVPQLANTLTGGAVDKYAFKPVTGAVDSLLGGPGEGRTLAEASQDTRSALDTLKSPQLRQKEQELADTKGFLPSAKKILTDPSLLAQQVAEQVPQLVAPGGVVRKAGAMAFERAAGSALAKGVEKRVAAGMTEEAATQAAQKAAERVGRRAAINAGTKAAIGTEAAMSGSQNSEQAQQEVMGLDQKVLDANPDYQALIARGVSPQQARETLAQQAGGRAGLAGAAITAATGGITGRLESKIFQGETGIEGVGKLLSGTGAKELAKATGKEFTQEALQEGGEQFGQNLGVQSVDPNKDLMDQVPEQAALGGVVGGVLGGGTFAGSAAMARPHNAAVPNPGAAPGSLSEAANVLAEPAGPLGRAAQAAQVGGLRPNEAGAEAAGVPPVPAPAPAAQSPLQAAVAEYHATAAQADASGIPPDVFIDRLAQKHGASAQGLWNAVTGDRAAPADTTTEPAAPAPASAALPWVNATTGEVGKPTKGQLTQVLADHIVQTFDTQGHMRINADDLAAQWGVTKKMINQVRPAAQEAANNRVRAAQNPSLNEPSGNAGQLPTGATDGNERVPGAEAAAPATAGAAAAGPANAEPAAISDHGPDRGAEQPDTAVPAAVAGPNAAGDANAAVAPAVAAGETAAAKKEPSSAEKPNNVPGQPEAQGDGVDRALGRAGGEGQGGAASEAAPRVPGQAPQEEAASPRAGVPAAEAAQPAPAVASTKTPPAGGVSGSSESVNPVQAALRAMATGQHPEKALTGTDDSTVRAVAKAMGRTFSAKASTRAIVERLGEQPASEWRGQAEKAMQAKTPAAPAHKVSAAARDAEGLRIKTADGETNGRSHVDSLIKDGFTKVDSRRVGDKLVHSLVNAAGERAPIKARQLRYAQEVAANQGGVAPSTGKTSTKGNRSAARVSLQNEQRAAEKYLQRRVKVGNTFRDEPFKNAHAVGVAIKRIGADPSHYTIEKVDGGFIGVRRSELDIEADAAMPAIEAKLGIQRDTPPRSESKANEAPSAGQKRTSELLGGAGVGDTVRTTGMGAEIQPGSTWKIERIDKDGTLHTSSPGGGTASWKRSELEREVRKGATFEKLTPPTKPIDVAAHEAATSPHNDKPEPTQPQIEAGNYEKGHITVHGLDISIENPKGSARSGVGEDGKPWSHVMSDHYGYIRRTEGADGEHIDTYVGPHPDSNRVFVVDQLNQKTGAFDEHKVMLGFRTQGEAVRAYRSNFDPGWKVGKVKDMTVDQFKAWLKDGDTTKPAATAPTVKESLTVEPAAPATTEKSSAVAGKQAPKRGGIATNGAKVRVVGGKLQYVPRAPETLAAYFKPGDVVPSYGGQDRVISTDFSEAGNPLVRVIAVDKDGNIKPNERERVHGTMPTERELVAKLGKPVLAEKAATAKPAAAAVADEPAAAATTGNTKDAGEELWANRRNSSGKGLGWNDIADLNDTLKAREAVKTKVWPRPNYAELVDGGMPAPIAHVIKQVYDAIATKPQARVPTDQHYQDYIAGVQKLRDAAFAWAKQVMDKTASMDAKASAGVSSVAASSGIDPAHAAAIVSALRIAANRNFPILDALFPMPAMVDGRSQSRFRTGEQGAANNALAYLLGGNKIVSAMQVSESSLRDATRAMEKGWPAAQEAWEKTYAIHESKAGEKVRRNGQSETLAEPEFWVSRKVGKRFSSIVADGFKTREEAVDAAKAAYARQRQAGGDGAKAEAPVELQNARTGPERRAANEDVTSDQLRETFGFKGINFGNWMKGDGAKNAAERQAHLNHAYDAFHDLAEIMGLPAKAMSLNGTLGLAIGAQGTGGKKAAAAHFVPGVNEINLTREQGAGSLAHEWAHALDHYFAAQAGGRVVASKDPFLTEHLANPGDGVRPEVRRAFKTIVEAMETRPETEAEQAARLSAYQKRGRDGVESVLRTARQAIEQNGKGDKAAALEQFDAMAQRLRVGDIGEGYVKTGKGQMDAAPQVVGQVANLVKETTGRKPDWTDALSSYARMVSGVVAAKSDNTQRAQRVTSDFAKEARKLEGTRTKPYWSTKLEMFARAFQSYVLDKLAMEGNRNSYLTRSQMDPATLKAAQDMGVGEAGDRYPRGAEREAINKAFDTLVGELKTREGENGNVVLFSLDRSGAAVEGRVAATLADARNAASQFIGKPIANDNGLVPATVSGVTLGKMLSDSAVRKSTSVVDHVRAVANLDTLYRMGMLDETHADKHGEPTIAAIHRVVAPMVGENGEVLAVKMTVKETTHPGMPNPLYSVETLEVDSTEGVKPARKAPQSGIEREPGQDRHSPQAGFSPDVTRMLEEFKRKLPLFRQTNDTTTAAAPVTAAQEAHTARIKQIATAAMGKWKGDDVPALRVVATPEQLPAAAKVAANGLASNAYKTAAGMYDGRTIWIVASAHKTDQAGIRRILTTMAHEGVGHYGVERIVERELGAGAWTKIETATERLRANPELASPSIRAVLDDVGKRYRGADAPTFAKEFLAVTAERGVKNGLLDRVVTAIRQWLRRVMPDLRLSEHEFRQLLVQSDQYLRVGESQQQRVQSRAAMAFSRSDQTDTPAFKRWFGESKVVDAAGNPLPVFHGTADDFDAFDPNRSGSATAHMTATLGSFFAEDRAKAQHYAENASHGVPAEERVIDAYLSIQKPYEMSLKQFMGIDSREESQALRDRLIGEGYDGIHLKDIGQWVAFQPTQIKSASENRGTFDPGNPNIYFSRDENADPDNPRRPKRNFADASASIEAIEAELPKLDRGAFQQVKDWLAGKARDLEPTALGALQLRHVLELASEDPTLKGPAQQYANTYQRMDGDRNSLTVDGAAKVDALVKWARKPGLAGWLGKVRPEAKKLFDFMNAVTQLAVDPTNQYERLLMRDAGNEYKPWTKELIKERTKVLRETALTRSGDDKTRIYDEIKDLQRLPAREKAREQKYPELVRQWNALTPEAKEQFQVMRDHYREQSEALEEATLAHIASLDIPEQNKRAAAALVNRNFADAKVDGVYFPLTRFGDYWLSLTTKDGEYVYAKYESANALQQAEKRFLAAGATIEARGRQDNNYRAKDAPSGTFIGDLMGVLKNAPDTVKDEIYQMYLKALPSLSLRKHGIHRKNIAGFTDDVPRAFASSVFHGAHQLSKARYGWQLTNTLDQMRERMEARRTAVSATEAAHADALIGEINRRHDWILNPTNNALSNKATGIAFTYFLGASPASAIVNLIQVPQIVLPVMGAQHGWGKASAALGRAMKQAIGTGGHIEKVLTGEDLEAYRALAKQGTFQRSATHALAGISEGDQLRSSAGYTKVMNAVSWMFHTSEVINREATGMAAYRLARANGQNVQDALKYADQITNGTHGDYSNANRARYMQGNVQKVVLQFKNYSLAMSWLWGRNFYKAFKGEDVATRQLARRTLTGMLGMTGLFAGVIGMPIFNLLRYGAQALHAVGGDDDEPWDFVTEFRSWLAEHLGETAANVIADGAVSQLGANVASRVSMSDLWFRDADKQLEGEDAYNNMLQSIAGPLGGMIKNMYVGSQQFSDGHTWRGIETMLPTFAKNAMKATRFASQGVNTLTGNPIVQDISTPQALIQAIGFQPTEVAKQQRINNANVNYEQFIENRRQSLMNAFAMAQQAGDADGRSEALDKISVWNRKYPEYPIRMSNLHASLRGRARAAAESDHGIRLNKKLANRVRSEVGAMAQSGE